MAADPQLLQALRELTAAVKAITQGGGQNSGIISVLQQLVRAMNSQTQTIGESFPNWVEVPATASSPGVAGQVAYESGFLYVCVASDTWERVAIATF